MSHDTPMHPFLAQRISPHDAAAHGEDARPPLRGRPLKDPQLYSYDRNAQPIYLDFRQDLLASNVVQVGPSIFVVAQYQVPARMVLAVKAFVPYAMQRINVGAADETFQMIQTTNGSGFFLFEPQVNDAAAFNARTDYNAPQIAVPAPNNNLRQRGRGVSFLSNDPWSDAHKQWYNPLFSFVVEPTQVLRVLFSILPAASSNPLPTNGQYTVGAASVKRVDFAGVVMVGQQMSAQAYRSQMQQLQDGA